MVNRIKDRQTGEYHDIGGLKCKLVAEGILEWEEEIAAYKSIYNFEEGKTYFIFIELNGEQVQFIGAQYKNMMRTQYVLDWSSDSVICLVGDENNSVYIFDKDAINLDYCAGFPYKVYELPFALEV